MSKVGLLLYQILHPDCLFRQVVYLFQRSFFMLFAVMVLCHPPGDREHPGRKSGQIASVTAAVAPGFFKSLRGQVFGQRAITNPVTEKVIDLREFRSIEIFKIRCTDRGTEPD
jgi:hypothetical protein